jgi:hypothetical protein
LAESEVSQALFTPARLRDDLTILLFLKKSITPAKYLTYFQRYYRTLLVLCMVTGLWWCVRPILTVSSHQLIMISLVYICVEMDVGGTEKHEKA